MSEPQAYVAPRRNAAQLAALLQARTWWPGYYDHVMSLEPNDQYWIYISVSAYEFSLLQTVEFHRNDVHQPTWLPVGVAVGAREALQFKAYPLPEQTFDHLKHWTIFMLNQFFDNEFCELDRENLDFQTVFGQRLPYSDEVRGTLESGDTAALQWAPNTPRLTTPSSLAPSTDGTTPWNSCTSESTNSGGNPWNHLSSPRRAD